MAPEKYEEEGAPPSIGDSILLKFNFCDEEGQVVEEQQFQGVIEKITESEVIIRHPSNGKEVSLPPHFGSYLPAKKGLYDLPSTGEQVRDPDFITEWTLRASSGT
jgi:hypothetical protein